MAYSGIIVGKHKDKKIPDDYLAKVLGIHESCFCSAFIDDKGFLEVVKANGTSDVESIQEMCEVYTGETIFFFGTYENEYHEDDLQPFVLLTDNEDHSVLVAFAEGEFSTSHPESTHSPAFFMVNEFLKEEIDGLWEDAEQDMEKFLPMLDTSRFKRAMRGCMLARGVVTLMTNKGHMLTIGKNNDIAGSFPWGFTSNTLDYTEAEETATSGESEDEGVIDQTKPMSWKEKMALKSKGQATSVPKVTPKDKVVTPETSPRLAQQLKDSVSGATIAQSVKNKEPIVFPPADVVKKGKHELKKWMNLHIKSGPNFRWPGGWDTGQVGIPASLVKENSTIKASVLKDFKDLPTGMAAATATPDGTIVQEGSPKSGGITTKNPPIIPTGQRDELAAKFFPNITLIDPEKIKDTEEKFPHFWEANAKYTTQAKTLRMSTDDFGRLATMVPNAAKVLMRDMRILLWNHAPQLFELEEEEEAPTQEEITKVLSWKEKQELKKQGRM